MTMKVAIHVQSRSPRPSRTDAIQAELVEEFLERIQAGERVDPSEFAAQYPEHADALAQLLPALQMMADLSRSALHDRSILPPTGESMRSELGVLGDFRILREVGRGGMGVVYEAEQLSLRRRVALKVLPFAAALDSNQLKRFKTEAQAAAQLHHTNIVPVFWVGCEQGVHYYAMQFIEGRSLAEVIKELRQIEGTEKREVRSIKRAPAPITTEPSVGRGSLDPAHRGSEDLAPSPKLDPETTSRQNAIAAPAPTTTRPDSTRNRDYFRNIARLGIEAAEALEHAHQEGIIHRDIKPANVMVDAKGHLWITDFGLARLQSDSGLTITGDLIGTLRYMSPEQAMGRHALLDGRTDIYSLGITLYELLTLQPAFGSADRQELLRHVADLEPRPLRALNGSIPRELETIILKATSKEAASRYATAQELADDLRRFLDFKPIRARRPQLPERIAKWARRHRVVLTTALVFILLGAVALAAGVALFAIKDQQLARHLDDTRRHRYAADIHHAYGLVQKGQTLHASELLDRWKPAPGERDPRSFEWYYVRRLCHDERRTLRGHKGAVYRAEFSPDGRTLASCGQDGTVRFWEVATGKWLGAIEAHSDEVNDAAFSPDGRTLATVSDDGTIKLWDVETRSEQATVAAHKGDAIAIRFLPDGQRLVSAGRNDSLLKLWDRATLKEVASKRAHETAINAILPAPDGKILASAGDDGDARLWNLADLEPIKSLPRQRCVYGLAFSSNGSQLATADASGRVRTWDLASGTPKIAMNPHSDDVQAVAFLDHDRLLVSADGHAMLRLSDANNGTVLEALSGHTGKIWGISVSPDGTTFATVSSDGTVKLWDASLPRRWLEIPVEGSMGSLAFTPDGQTLIVGEVAGGKSAPPPNGVDCCYVTGATLQVTGFDPRTGAQRFRRVLKRNHNTYLPADDLTGDGAIARFGCADDAQPVWNVATGKLLAKIDHLHAIDRSGVGYVHPPDAPIEIMDLVTGQKRVLRGTEHAAFLASCPAARLVALRDRDELAIWDVATNRLRRKRAGHQTGLSYTAFSPDGAWLAAATIEPRGAIEVWDVKTLELIDTLAGHSEIINGLFFSPDGSLLASTGGDQVLKLWDMAARVEVLSLQHPFRPCAAVAFSPDGRTLAFHQPGGGERGLVIVLPTSLPEDLASEK